mmetsp:Transcript_10704/g.35462  ORF Transcript_10704/g.35462 Transcript_10704/m.35462 type:complete len:214 (+) Transcript_10704:670-1311(+)
MRIGPPSCCTSSRSSKSSILRDMSRKGRGRVVHGSRTGAEELDPGHARGAEGMLEVVQRGAVCNAQDLHAHRVRLSAVHDEERVARCRLDLRDLRVAQPEEQRKVGQLPDAVRAVGGREGDCAARDLVELDETGPAQLLLLEDGQARLRLATPHPLDQRRSAVQRGEVVRAVGRDGDKGSGAPVEEDGPDHLVGRDVEESDPPPVLEGARHAR